MKVKVWGCRGSLAAPGPQTVRYGGNTSCVEIGLENGTLLILDAGTGLRLLGQELGEPRGPIHILLSHLHLDHLQGIGFFPPLWSSNAEIHLWGPPSPVEGLAERISRYLSPPLFPVHLGEIPARLEFHDAVSGRLDMAGADVWSQPILHSGPTVGYRIEENGRSMAYLPDHEPALGGDIANLADGWLSGFGLAGRVDLLLHDAQYTPEEYVERVGWGHSSIEHVVAYGQRVEAGHLLLFHHDPLHDDEELEELLIMAKELWQGPGDPPELAYEGMELEL